MSHTPTKIALLTIASMMLCPPAPAQDRGPDRDPGERQNQDPDRAGERGERPPQGRRPSFMERMMMLPVIGALDTDKSGALSTSEIADATSSLLALDANDDGNLTSDELAAPPEAGLPRMPGMMSFVPIMRALDIDGDEELFEDEVTDAATLLLSIDENGDGELDKAELAPGFGRTDQRGMPGNPDAAPEVTPLPHEMDPKDAVPTVPDRETFKMLAYKGPEVMIDTHLAGQEFIKIQLEGAGTDNPRLYYMNTKTHRSHPGFMRTFGIPTNAASGQMRGVIVYRPMLLAPNGEPGLYTYEWEPNDAYAFEMVKIAHDLIEEHSDLMRGRLAYNLLPRSKEKYITEPEKYEAAALPVYDEAESSAEIVYLPLHMAESFGRLRLMTLEERPGPRDVVIYPTLPNEMPRVAGIITGVRQTPLSHVNLRAIQDDVPNAYIADVANNRDVMSLVGKYVSYRVSVDGYELREATTTEVESHFADMRPTEAQIPPRDLTVTTIRPLREVGFDDAESVGVKAANIATMGRFGFPQESVPQGYAVPFIFYDEFMKYNDFYAMAQKMIADRGFQTSADTREESLDKFQKTLKKGEMPRWMTDALTEVQRAFPRGTSIRCRSSTNNEDLPGFSGAGLYDSYTHHPDEGHLSKSVKQVFASLWNYRAYEEREFYRIDHFAAAMGVLMHPNTDLEQANGVAVTADIMYQGAGQTGRRFYVNSQVGEDLVTNPGSQSVPEEMLLSPRNPRTDRIMQRSNQVSGEGSMIGAEHLMQLRRSLRTIHQEFAKLYDVAPEEEFAMEVEFKVTADGNLFIKQARPWVY